MTTVALSMTFRDSSLTPYERLAIWLVRSILPLSVAAWLVIVQLVVPLAAGRMTTPLFTTFLWLPSLWLSLSMFALFAAAPFERITLKRVVSLAVCGVSAGLMLVGCLLAAGYIGGFGRSPYDHSPVMIVLNGWFAASQLAGVALARWLLVRTWGHSRAGFASVVLFMALVALPYGTFETLRFANPIVDGIALAKLVLPVVALSLAHSLLVRRYGLVPLLAVSLPITLFEWLMPILPVPSTLAWVAAMTVGPFLVVEFTGRFYRLIDPAAAPMSTISFRGPTRAELGWLAAAAAAVTIIWFQLGVFGVQPYLVAGQSMQPNMWMGDLAIVRKVPIASLKVGDVIQFRQGDILVMHRVHEITTEGGKPVFRTRGDNNRADDPLVKAEDVRGLVVADLPKVGMPVLFAKAITGQVR